MVDFGTLAVVSVIMHELPRGRGSGSEHGVILSEAPIELEERDQRFLEVRLRQVLGGSARQVVEAPEEGSSVSKSIRGLVDGSEDLITTSRELAIRMRSMQSGIAPPSIFLTATTTIDGAMAVVIAKLEHEQGMRVEQTTLEDGRRTYRAQYLRDLILGEGTKVFKVASFPRSLMPEAELLTGFVVDVQQGAGAVADYFIHFLGCEFVVEPRVLTERFFAESQRWIRATAAEDPERLAEYEIALLAELQSRKAQITPAHFARASLLEDHRDGYLKVLGDKGVPTGGFAKDVSLIESQIRRVKVQTARGATIYVPPEMHRDGALSIEQIDGRLSRVTIEDEIRGITGASGARGGAT